MNFVNLKKLLVLSSVLMAFGNTSYASSSGNPMKVSITYDETDGNIINEFGFQKVIDQIDKGIISSIEDRNDILEKIYEKMCGNDENNDENKLNTIKDSFKGNEDILIESWRKSLIDKIMEDEFDYQTLSNDSRYSLELIIRLLLINGLENIKNNLGNQNENAINDKATYNLFMKIASNISEDNIKKLEELIKEKNSFGKNLNKISNISKYKVKKEDLDILNNILKADESKFVVSPNHKIHYCKYKKDYDEFDSKNIKEKRNNILEQIMDVVNTEFTMSNDEYIDLSKLLDNKHKNKINDFRNNYSHTSVKTMKEFKELIRGVINGNINKNDGNKNNNNNITKNNNNVNNNNVNNQQNKNGLHVNNNVGVVNSTLQNNGVNNNVNNNNLHNNNNVNNKQLNNDGVNVNNYYIPGISDVLKSRGFAITDIIGSEVKPNGYTRENTFSLNDKGRLLSYVKSPCTILLDASIDNRINKGVKNAVDRLRITEIGQLVFYKNKMDNKFRELLLAHKNNYLILTIEIEKNSSN